MHIDQFEYLHIPIMLSPHQGSKPSHHLQKSPCVLWCLCVVCGKNLLFFFKDNDYRIKYSTYSSSVLIVFVLSLSTEICLQAVKILLVKHCEASEAIISRWVKLIVAFSKSADWRLVTIHVTERPWMDQAFDIFYVKMSLLMISNMIFLINIAWFFSAIIKLAIWSE